MPPKSSTLDFNRAFGAEEMRMGLLLFQAAACNRKMEELTQETDLLLL